MEEQIRELNRRIDLLEKTVFSLVRIDRVKLDKLLQFAEGKDIQLGTATGTKIGTGTDQKLAFFNATPVIQQASIADADGTLAHATSRINAILDVLDIFGLTA